MSVEGFPKSEGRLDGGRCTKYQPVGFPVSPSLSWEVRTKRTLGSSGIVTTVS